MFEVDWYLGEDTMKAHELIPGRIYRMAEFSRIGGTGKAISHPPDEPDMQSSFAIDPEFVDREATAAEAALV